MQSTYETKKKMMTGTDNFFQEQREQSFIKARIVTKYFSAWSRVILSKLKNYSSRPQKMAYVDLFAGPGRYEDQTESTPLMVLETILANPELTNRMVTIFNDKDIENLNSLKTEVYQLDGIGRLKHAPTFHCEEVGEEIFKIFLNLQFIPTFFFVDPWGYKGLSLKLISSIIKDWGCDCVFFFNYNRVNMGINNKPVESHMASLFGDQQLNTIQQTCKDLPPDQREGFVVQALCDALRKNGSKFVLPFRFKNEKGTRTSHHLIFLSKSFVGYNIMKDIMYKESSENIGGIASFEYNPRIMNFKQGSLFDMLSRPLDDLECMLIDEYAGKTVDFKQLFEDHSVDKPYIMRNYKDVLKTLYEREKIIAFNPRTGKPPRKGTFSDNMRITFVE